MLLAIVLMVLNTGWPGGRRNPLERQSLEAGLAGHPVPHRQLRQQVLMMASLCKAVTTSKTPLCNFTPQKELQKVWNHPFRGIPSIAEEKAGEMEDDNITEDNAPSMAFR